MDYGGIMSKIEKQEAKEKITALKLEKKLNYEDQKNASNYLKVVNEKIGFVPNVLKAFSNFPKQFEGFTKLYNSIMLGEELSIDLKNSSSKLISNKDSGKVKVKYNTEKVNNEKN